MSTITAERSEQARIALQHANQIRLARVALRRAIARREVSVCDVILDPPPEAESWRVFDLLTAQPSWGDSRARRLLNRRGIPELKAAGALTARQRHEIAAMIEALNGETR